MEKKTAISIFESLSSSVRLDIYHLLVEGSPDGLVAGDIAMQLKLPATNLSFHLKAMTNAGLLHVTQQGRYQRYRANALILNDVITYLTILCQREMPLTQRS